MLLEAPTTRPASRGGRERGRRGGAGMTETPLLLSKISAWRQRLEQAQGLAQEAESAAGADRVALLGRQVADGRDHDALLGGTLGQLGAPPAPARPGLLTSRA